MCFVPEIDSCIQIDKISYLAHGWVMSGRMLNLSEDNSMCMRSQGTHTFTKLYFLWFIPRKGLPVQQNVHQEHGNTSQEMSGDLCDLLQGLTARHTVWAEGTVTESSGLYRTFRLSTASDPRGRHAPRRPGAMPVPGESRGGQHISSSAPVSLSDCKYMLNFKLKTSRNVPVKWILTTCRWEGNPHPLECDNSSLQTNTRRTWLHEAHWQNTHTSSMLPVNTDEL